MRQASLFHNMCPMPIDALERLKPLSGSNMVELCREHATGRLLVLKSFDANMQRFFHREASNLHSLRNFRGAPRLYFAWTNPDGTSLLAREYFPGPTLNQAPKEDIFEKHTLADAISELIFELHDKFGMSHGDISPKNVVLIPDSAQPLGTRIGLLDWEFAQKFHEENLESYAHFRGSIGYVSPHDDSTLKDKDQKALAECLRYMGCNTISYNKKIQSKKTEKRRWLWI